MKGAFSIRHKCTWRIVAANQGNAVLLLGSVSAAAELNTSGEMLKQAAVILKQEAIPKLRRVRFPPLTIYPDKRLPHMRMKDNIMSELKYTRI